jgi:hypothetical protein
MEMGTLFATWITVWAGSIFGSYPYCQNPNFRLGSMADAEPYLQWCNVLSVLVGVGDIGALLFVGACYFYQVRDALHACSGKCGECCCCSNKNNSLTNNILVAVEETELGQKCSADDSLRTDDIVEASSKDSEQLFF